jgi:hypothetical protein
LILFFKYVAYLRWLTLKSMKDSATSNAGGPEEQLENEAAVPAGEQRPKKRRKTTRTKKYLKRGFDISPANMNDHEPSSGKQTIPFKNMVSKRWQEDHTAVNFLDGVDWLKGFYSRLGEEDLMKEDGKYLKELEEWHGEDSADDETEPQTLVL